MKENTLVEEMSPELFGELMMALESRKQFLERGLELWTEREQDEENPYSAVRCLQRLEALRMILTAARYPMTFALEG